MPWGGKSKLTVSTKEASRAVLKLRVPGWARNDPVPGSLYTYADQYAHAPTVAINRTRSNSVIDRFGYITLDRLWQNGDTIEIEFPFATRRVVADQRVKEDRGRVAIERGPIVYCAEWPDCEDGAALDLMLEPQSQITPARQGDIPGGVTVLNATARRITKPAAGPRPVRLIPYYLWANRGPGQMNVWLATREYVPGDVGPAGGLIFLVNINYLADGWRYLEAAPFDQSAGAKWGCFRRAISGARGTAVGTGKQNTADIIAACNEPDAAAALCAHLNLNGFSDWFLPSRDELALMYANLKKTSVSDFGTRGIVDNFSYWTSSQQTADMANHIDFADLGRLHYDDKDFPRRVRAVRAF
jgi:uncharacterized protein